MAHPYRLYIVRHLKTEANQSRQYCGWTDIDIADTSAEAVEFPFAVNKVYGSDLKRTRQTAAMYFPEAAYTGDAGLRECNFGDFEMKTYEELQHDPDYRAWIDDPWNTAPRNGESLQQMKARVTQALDGLPDESVVVTHSGVIRLLLDLFSSGGKTFWEHTVKNGSIWKFEWVDEQQMKEGLPCTSISEVPITARRTM